MATISFSTKPQKRYYSYKSDGCIYKITSTKPTTKAEGGGMWYCYFNSTPYAKVDEKTYLLYQKVTVDGVDTYEATTSSSYYVGDPYCYYDGSKYVEYKVEDNGYYTSNGTTKYNCPNSAKELPKVVYGNTTYYFDTLISNGDTYKDNVFTAMNIDDGDSTTTTTYGSILLDDVKDSISLNAFNTCVAKLPEYLTGGDLTKEYTIDNIGYVLPANYLIVYGKLFVEKLNEYMKEYGDAVISKYSSTNITTKYKKATILSKVTDEAVGTLTTTPSES